MPQHRWVIDFNDLNKEYFKNKKIWDRYFRDCEIDRRKYFEGFNVGREKQMYQEELQDLEVVYKTALSNYQKEVEHILPPLLRYMEEFLSLHKQNEVIREKLDALLAKQGRQNDEEEGEDDE